MSGLTGYDAHRGYFADPVAFHDARRRGAVDAARYDDDPIRGLYETLALWEGEAPRRRKGTKSKVRMWRLEGLMHLSRPLTAEEDREFDELCDWWKAQRRKQRQAQTPDITERKADQ